MFTSARARRFDRPSGAAFELPFFTLNLNLDDSMKVITALSTAILFLLPGAIVSAYAQEHEQQKKPEQKHQQAKPAQHQQRAQDQRRAVREARPPACGSFPCFGNAHRFHVNRSEFASGPGPFQYGGYWLNMVEPWPVGGSIPERSFGWTT